MDILQIPTSIRFKKKKDADFYGTNTKTWHPIRELQNNGDGYFQISTNTFAWVHFNTETVEKELEFKYNEKHPEKIFDEDFEEYIED